MRVYLTALFCLSLLSGSALAGDKPFERPRANTARGDQCVEPTEVMRRDHMDFILHQRDRTMHKGVRTTKHSLKNCVECHANPETNSVLGKDGFCESCHTHTAVTMDCFTCHTPSPAKKAATTGSRLDRLAPAAFTPAHAATPASTDTANTSGVKP